MNNKLAFYIIAIICSSFTLRIIYTSISPLQIEIQQDLNASFSDFGLLSTLPQLCAGLCSFAFPFLLRRYNAEQIGLIGLGLMSVLLTTPVLLTSVAWFFLFVIIVGSGIAICQPALQAVIKQHFPNHTMQLVALLVLCMHLGSSFAAISTHQFADYFGDWHWSLFLFGGVSLIAAIVWFKAFSADINQKTITKQAKPSLDTSYLYFNKTTWLIVLYFTSSGVVYISLLAWLPNYFHDLSSNSHQAANMLGIFVFNQAIAAFALTLFSRDHWNKKAMLYMASILTLLSTIVAVAAPDSLIVLFPILAGLGLGISFPVAMSLPHSYGNNMHETATLSMFGLGLGSSFSAPFPFIIGWLKDNTDIPHILMWIMLLSVMTMLLSTYFLKPIVRKP